MFKNKTLSFIFKVLFDPHSLSEGQKIVRTRNAKFRKFEVFFGVIPLGELEKLKSF